MTDCDYNSLGDMNSSGGGMTSISGGETRTNLIINYLPQSLTDQEFYKIFVVIGPIKNCRIMKDLKTAGRTEEGGDPEQQTGYSFGFGFVEYLKPQDAANAILQLNNLPVQHKRIKVSYARPPGEDIKETNLYIQNIPRSYSLDQLEDLFSPFGQIVQKNLLKDKVTGLPRGVGFVRYDKKSEAELAIEQMNGIIPNEGNEPLVVKVAEEHGKMKAAYYAGYHAGRGRGNFNNRGGGGIGYSRGSYNNTGKINNDRGNNRFNPVSGGGYITGDYSSPLMGGEVGGNGMGRGSYSTGPPMRGGGYRGSSGPGRGGYSSRIGSGGPMSSGAYYGGGGYGSSSHGGAGGLYQSYGGY